MSRTSDAGAGDGVGSFSVLAGALAIRRSLPRLPRPRHPPDSRSVRRPPCLLSGLTADLRVRRAREASRGISPDQRDDDGLESSPRFHPLKYRSRWHHPEVRNASLAGWGAVIAWLRAGDVGSYPDHGDRKRLAWMLRELKRLPRVVRPPYLDRSRVDEEPPA
jgi:hypothetical protein